jgi:hypothetical protein
VQFRVRLPSPGREVPQLAQMLSLGVHRPNGTHLWFERAAGPGLGPAGNELWYSSSSVRLQSRVFGSPASSEGSKEPHGRTEMKSAQIKEIMAKATDQLVAALQQGHSETLILAAAHSRASVAGRRGRFL